MSVHSKNLNILLVEDTPALQLTSKEFLENCGCVVTVAATVAEALEKFNLSFDGMLTDVGLPDGTGFEVIEHIHQTYPQHSLVIYVYTAYGRDYVEERCAKAGIQGYFDKPCYQDDIKNFVEAVRDNKRIVAP